MAATRGQLDPQGSPLVTVAVFPEGEPHLAKEFGALIDTGFTGFAAMPIGEASNAGLQATGTMDLTYADGTIHPTPVGWASVRLGTEVVEGFVFLLEGDDVAVGVHFLRLFKKTLVYSVAERSVVLTDMVG